MKYVTLLSLALAFVFIGGDAMAKKRKKKRKKKSAPTEEVSESTETMSYGMAGCGLGSTFFKKNDMMSQTLAATTNGTSGNQTFGITSGTSGCTAGSDMAALEKEVFITNNFQSLRKEAAQGHGEHLSAFAELLGCEYTDFASVSQNEFGNLYGSANAREVLSAHLVRFNSTCQSAG